MIAAIGNTAYAKA